MNRSRWTRTYPAEFRIRLERLDGSPALELLRLPRPEHFGKIWGFSQLVADFFDHADTAAVRDPGVIR